MANENIMVNPLALPAAGIEVVDDRGGNPTEPDGVGGAPIATGGGDIFDEFLPAYYISPVDSGSGGFSPVDFGSGGFDSYFYGEIDSYSYRDNDWLHSGLPAINVLKPGLYGGSFDWPFV